jgi:hypothetical protein
MSDYFVDFESVTIDEGKIIDQGIISMRADAITAVHANATPETSRIWIAPSQYADVRGSEDEVLSRLRVRRSYLEGYVE